MSTHEDGLLSEAIKTDLGRNCSVCYKFLEAAEEHMLYEDHTQSLSVTDAIIKIAYYYKKEPELLSKVFSKDLSLSMDLTIAFRETNISVLALRSLFNLFRGEKLFLKTVRKLTSITNLINLPDDVDDEVLAMQLMITCKEILSKYHTKLQSLSSSNENGNYTLFVRGFGAVFGGFASALEAYFPASENNKQLLDSLYFLRFISPMILSSSFQSLFIRKGVTISKSQHSHFVYLTKLIQAVANNQKDIRIIPSLSKRYLKSFIGKTHSLTSKITTLLTTSTPAIPLYLAIANLPSEGESNNSNNSSSSSNGSNSNSGNNYNDLSNFRSDSDSSIKESNIKVFNDVNAYMRARVEPGEGVFNLDENIAKLRSIYAEINLGDNASAWLPTTHFIRSYTSEEALQFKKEVREHQKLTYGFVLAPFEPHSAILPLFGVLWSLQYEIASVKFLVNQVDKEVIQATVSHVNKCHLCLDLHTTAAMSYGISYSSIDKLIHEKRISSKVTDVTERMKELVKWALVSHRRGHDLLFHPPFFREEAPEVMGAAVLKHYFNRITNTFLTVFTRAKGSFWKSKMFERKMDSIRSARGRFRLPSRSLRYAPSLHQPTDLPYLEMFFSFLDDKNNNLSRSSSQSVSKESSNNIHSSNNVGSGNSNNNNNNSSSNNNNNNNSINHSSSDNLKKTTSYDSLTSNSVSDISHNEYISTLRLEGEEMTAKRAVSKSEDIVNTSQGGWRGKLLKSFEWASTNSIISEALYRWQLLEEVLAKECIPPNVLHLLHEVIDDWDGTTKIPRSQMNTLVSHLTPSEQIIARLTISIANDPTKASTNLINQYLSLFPSGLREQYLVGACSYAAFYATQHIASFWCSAEY